GRWAARCTSVILDPSRQSARVARFPRPCAPDVRAVTTFVLRYADLVWDFRTYSDTLLPHLSGPGIRSSPRPRQSMSTDEEHVAHPRLYGAPAYARPPSSVVTTPLPLDPDDLPIA